MSSKERSCCVYRFYDADGCLLYIGMSTCIAERISAHQSSADWFPTCTKLTIEHFEERSCAVDAERKAIIFEKPAYNVQHNVRDVLGVETPTPEIKIGDIMTVNDLITYLGEDQVATALGVSRKAVRVAARKGVLAAMWYDELEYMAGCPLPRHFFSFKGRIRSDAA